MRRSIPMKLFISNQELTPQSTSTHQKRDDTLSLTVRVKLPITSYRWMWVVSWGCTATMGTRKRDRNPHQNRRFFIQTSRSRMWIWIHKQRGKEDWTFIGHCPAKPNVQQKQQGWMRIPISVNNIFCRCCCRAKTRYCNFSFSVFLIGKRMGLITDQESSWHFFLMSRILIGYQLFVSNPNYLIKEC